MGLNQKAIDSIMNLSSTERYNHSIKRIADSEVLYVLADKEGNWVFWGDKRNTYLAVWPELEFAQIVLNEQKDDNAYVYEIELVEFLEDGIPWLIESKIGIATFPVLISPEVANISALEFAAAVNKILDESYGEALDLPYL